MARKGENIYKRKDGRYEGRYIKSYDINGKAVWGYIYGRTYAETKEKLAVCRVNSKSGKQLIASDLTLSEWITKWIDSQRQIKHTTKMMYQSHLKNHIEGSIGKVKLKKLNEDIIQAFIDDLTEKYSAKTIHTIFSMLRLALADAKRRKLIADIYSDVRMPKIKQRAVKVLSKEEQKRLEKAIFESENRYDIGILICLYTGIRIGELCALRWENINLKNATMTIEQTVQRVTDTSNKAKTKIRFDSPKSLSSVRTIPIPKFLVTVLKKYQRETGFILRDNGEFTDTRNISRRFKQLLKEADIEDMSFHCLRHSFSTRALELGFDPKTLSEILGHSNVTTTLNLYAHSLPEHKRKEMERLGGLFKYPSE